MSEFRDAIAEAVDPIFNLVVKDRTEIADDVLAMPEMVAIRQVLRDAAFDAAFTKVAMSPQVWLSDRLGRGSLVDWVMGDDDE